MSLTRYHEKRRFQDTPEPPGRVGKSAKALRFVVQKHEASRLHYDFRLEMEGVLKSWAIPKGPSMSPGDKRLAVQVEDHPLEYRTFEGVIPEGNYGAGTVMIWDEGTYHSAKTPARDESENELLRGLEDGRLHFFLLGKKLRGEFTLIRMRGKGDNWLLIKNHDEFASQADVREQKQSARSHRSMRTIARKSASEGKVWASNRNGAARPRVHPMLATLVDHSFDRPGWLFEIKWDGFRALADIHQGKVDLYSRNQKSLAGRFGPIADSLQHFPHDALLDGEIVALDDQGRAQFQLLQNYQTTGRGNLVYMVFDLLELDGEDLRRLPLKTRKQKLAKILRRLPGVVLSEHIEEQGKAFFREAVQRNLEGIIAKRADSLYWEGRRSDDWLKIKTRHQQEAVIAGFTEPRGSRKDLGALVLGIYDGNVLNYVGHTGSGFDAKSLAAVKRRLEPLVRKTSPFRKTPRTNAPVHWVEPEVVCEVAFQEWTTDGAMRIPIFLGLREDKDPRSVKREDPEGFQEVIDERHQSPRKGRKKSSEGPTLTYLTKVYFPEDNLTKGDLIEYYRAVAPVMLPYLRDRPLSMLRHPNGIHGKSFFQKDVARQPPPEWAATYLHASKDTSRDVLYLVCQDERTLEYVVNLGTIEINPWNSRLESLDRPDYVVIDLDPEAISFQEVVRTALEVRKVLDRAEIPCYPKTSGKTGLHLYIPLGAKYDYDQARQFGEVIAHLVNARLPKISSIERSPAKRQGRVYLDYLQNSQGQTLAAPYSVRPIAGAPISAPLLWKEVNARLNPAKFNLRTMLRRLDKIGDLWKPVLGEGVDLAKALQSLG